VSDNRDITAARSHSTPRYPIPAGPEQPGLTPDLAQVAALTLDAAIPALADAASLFALEHWLRGAPPSHPAAASMTVRRLGTGFTQAGRPAPDPAFPDGEILALAATSPGARCMTDRAPATATRPHDGTLERIRPGTRQATARYAWYLAAPVIAHRTVTGFLALARTPARPAFDTSTTQTAAHLAAQAAIGMTSSLTLHRSAASPPQPRQPAASRRTRPRTDIAARCIPAAGHHIGGDWYDIITLPQDRTGLIIGDVMGHGTPAAAVMTQLSTAAYALADLDLPPAQMLHQLNRTALTLPRTTFATCAYAIIDPHRHQCVIATAGHIPPVLAAPGGTTAIPRLPGGQALGITPASYQQARIPLPPRTVLALCTDGLTETRTRPLDQGIAELQAILARPHPHLDATCDDLITTLSGTHEDDITIILATTT